MVKVRQNPKTCASRGRIVSVVLALVVTLIVVLQWENFDIMFENEDEGFVTKLTIPQNENGLCPNKVRAGQMGDGGWWLCSNDLPKNDCVVYSFGIRDDFTFDHYMVNQFGCKVHGFDPSPMGLESKSKYEINDQAVYHTYGLGSADGTFAPGKVPFRWPGMDYLRSSNTYPWELKTLPSIMNELNTKKLTILKVDVEGGEWDMLPDLIKADWDQAYMELHFPPKEFKLTTPVRDDLIVIKKIRGKQYPPEQNVLPIDRLLILQDLLKVAHVFFWSRNGDSCLEIHFIRKKEV